jgi:homoserine dehydrogenase
MKKELGVGLLGFGTVGAGVVEGLQRNGDLIASRCGIQVALRKIADLDLDRDRGVKVDRSMLTRDANAVVEDSSVDVIIELIGGTGIARQLVEKALKLGKPVVTANKKLLAEYGDSLFKAAEQGGVDICFEASVGGGIPIIRALREGLVANNIESVHAILNGTCNYILTRMEQEGLAFDTVLKAAQEAGYAEAEPSLDIDGHDTAHKAAVVASLSYGFPVPLASVHVEGIRGLAQADIQYAAELGYRIKLLAIVGQESGGVCVRVHPTLVPHGHMLASVSGVFNAVLVRGDIVGDTLYYGRGAGRLPTASAVISDLADLATSFAQGSKRRLPSFILPGAKSAMGSMGNIVSRHYLRLALLDKPGVLGRVADVLGRHQISIASMVQKEQAQDAHVPVIMLTHGAKESDVASALAEIDQLDVVGGKTVRLRIEDFGEGQR